VQGRGLFGGKEAKVVLRPAPADSGVVFVRTDVPEAVRVRAVAPNLAERSRRTTIKKGSVSIETVEHCLAAISAMEVDNVTVEVNGSELPAPDCSCAEYFKVLKRAGVVFLAVNLRRRVLKRIWRQPAPFCSKPRRGNFRPAVWGRTLALVTFWL